MQNAVSDSRPVRNLLLSGFLSLLVFLIVSEPLLLHWNTAISVSARHPEAPPLREGLPGPHFEQMARFEAVYDMMRGRMPALHDLWQFNQGDDAATFRPDGFALPLSGLYALLRFAFPPAAAWNLTLWFTVWMTLHVLWIWLGSITRDRWARLPGIVLLLMIPHRWDLLFSGHPAGFGFMWIALTGICLDRARATPSRSRGILLGLSLLFLDWAAPSLTLPILAQLPVFWLWPRSGKTHPPPKQYRKLLPGLCGAGLLLLLFAALRTFHHPLIPAAGTPLPLHLHELWRPKGADRAPFLLADSLLALAGLGLLLRLLWRLRRQQRADRLLFTRALLLCAVAGGLTGLAIGLRADPHTFFVFVPLWLAGALTLACTPCPGEQALASFPRKAGMLFLSLWMVFFYGRTLHSTLCTLPEKNLVYAEISQTPDTALLLPLLPANHPAASLPLWMARQEGLRMVNGYGASAPQAYGALQESLGSLSQGFLSDGQFEHLRQMGVRHLILHENHFPAEASPFPVRETIFHLDRHPRLQPLKRDGPVRAWRLLDTPREPEQAERLFPAVFPRFRLEIEDLHPTGGLLLEESTAGGGSYWRVDSNAGEAPLAETTSLRLPPLPDRYWWVRMRGHGRLRVETAYPDAPSTFQDLSVSSLRWQWLPLPLPQHPPDTPLQLRLHPSEGNIDIDTLLLVGGLWPERWPTRGLEIPASVFFRTGQAAPSERAVIFLRDREPAQTVLRGPFLPFPADQPVRLELVFETPAPEGTRLGEFYVHLPETAQSKSVPVISGLPSVMIWSPETNLPVEMGFRFFRHGDLTVHSIRIESIFPEPGL